MERASTGKRLALAGLGGLSGLLLFVSDYPVHAWWLQVVALLPALWALSRLGASLPWAGMTGALVGLVSAGATSGATELPLLMGLPLALYEGLLWALIFVLGALARRLAPPPLSALAVAVAAAGVEWVGYTLLPVWGTAQAFVRVWTAAPWAAQLVWVVGVPGLVLAVVAIQALVVSLATERERRRPVLAALLVLVCVVGGLDAGLWARKAVGSLRVAAMGWTREQLAELEPEVRANLLARFYRPMLAEAIERGARFVVSPEVGLRMPAGERLAMTTELANLARMQGVWLAVGVFDDEHDDNRILFFDPNGEARGEYRKTHLIIGMEDYTAGDGELTILPAGGASLGGMICQDDNFTDLSRGYGRAGVQVLAVPTNDWYPVRLHHLENALLRPIESGYGIVRAASNGVSVIASARGEVLARRDHHADGPGVITADLPYYGGGSAYSVIGDWSLALFVVLVLVRLLLVHARRSSAANAGS